MQTAAATQPVQNNDRLRIAITVGMYLHIKWLPEVMMDELPWMQTDESGVRYPFLTTGCAVACKCS